MEIHIGNRVADVELLGKDGNKVRLDIDGQPYEVDIVMAENGACSILHDGHSYNAELIRSGGGKNYQVNTLFSSYSVDIIDSQAKYLRMRKNSEEKQGDKVVSPMPGKVMKIPVNEGDLLSAGDIVVVLEAMKMEHVLLAPHAGRVGALLAVAGGYVVQGQPLLVLEAVDDAADVGVQGSAAHDADHIRADLQRVIDRHAFTLDAARPEAIAKRHAQGGRTARENIADLCDDGSFIEYGALAIAAQTRRRSLDDLVADEVEVVVADPDQAAGKPRDLHVLRHLEGKQCRICYRYTHDEIDIFKAVSMPEKARVLDVSLRSSMMPGGVGREQVMAPLDITGMRQDFNELADQLLEIAAQQGLAPGQHHIAVALPFGPLPRDQRGQGEGPGDQEGGGRRGDLQADGDQQRDENARAVIDDQGDGRRHGYQRRWPVEAAGKTLRPQHVIGKKQGQVDDDADHGRRNGGQRCREAQVAVR